MNYPKDHPIWSLIRLTILSVAGCAIIGLMCNKFSADEWAKIISLLAAFVATEGGVKLLKRMATQTPEQ